MFLQHAFIATYGQQKKALVILSQKVNANTFFLLFYTHDRHDKFDFRNDLLKRALGFLVHVIDWKLLRCEINLIL